MGSTRIEYSDGSHQYKLRRPDKTASDRIPSVTGIVGVLDKPKLVPWAARAAAEYAVDHWAELADLAPSERTKTIGSAPWRGSQTKAAKGTQIHAWAESLLTGGQVSIPGPYVEQVQRFARWWETSGFVPEHTEGIVWADADALLGAGPYAGRFDCIAKHERFGRVLMDWKTGATGPWPDWAVQQAGYTLAEYLVDHDADMPMPAIDTIACVRIVPEGASLHVLDAEQRRAAEDRFNLCRALVAVAEPRFSEVVL